MATIKLTNLDAGSGDLEYLYKDVKLDFEQDDILTDSLFRGATSKDIMDSLDEAAIKNSLINLFTTFPGQKLLSPNYGLSISQFLFWPLDHDTAEQIGDMIVSGIKIYEPRVSIVNVNVNVNFDHEQYEITLILRIPQLSNSTVRFDGILQQPGFSFL